jgi:hypothetical protein
VPLQPGDGLTVKEGGTETPEGVLPTIQNGQSHSNQNFQLAAGIRNMDSADSILVPLEQNQAVLLVTAHA